MFGLLKGLTESVMGLIMGAGLLYGGSNLALKYVHDEVKKATVERLSKPQPSLGAFTEKLTGQKIDFMKPAPKKDWAKVFGMNNN